MVKITKLPPQEQHVFFQEHQFDYDLGGEDPVQFVERKWRKGPSMNSQEPDNGRKSSTPASRAKKKRIKRAEAALEGHENKEAILKILRSE
jgi:hypothetical protein